MENILFTSEQWKNRNIISWLYEEGQFLFKIIFIKIMVIFYVYLITSAFSLILT